MWALVELVEAAARAGDKELATDALNRLAATTQPAGTHLAYGVEARCRALFADGDDAEASYRGGIEQLDRAGNRTELARGHLVCGEWLRREGRLGDARERLRAAEELFVQIGTEAFAERARGELVAAGAKPRQLAFEPHEDLTPQEEQIARLAGDGLSNPEIGAQLFLSPRTVEWHLSKVFTKVGINSRRQLRDALRPVAGDP